MNGQFGIEFVQNWVRLDSRVKWSGIMRMMWGDVLYCNMCCVKSMPLHRMYHWYIDSRQSQLLTTCDFCGTF